MVMVIGEPSNGIQSGNDQPPQMRHLEDEQFTRREGTPVEAQEYEPDHQGALPAPIDEPMSIPELIQTLLRRTEETARSTNQKLEEFQNKILALEEARTRRTPLSAEHSPYQRIQIGDSPHSGVRPYHPTIEQPEEPLVSRRAGRPQNPEPRPSPDEPLHLALDRIDDQASTIKEMKEEMERMASRLHSATSSAPEIDRMLAQTRNSPFTKRLLAIQVQHVVKIKCPTYNGRTDPNRFLTAFGIAMGRAQYSQREYDAGYCQMFVESLIGDALDWFSKLEPGLIDSFIQLSRVFLKHYSMYIQPAATSADLYSIFQERNETLRSYIERFKTIASRVAVSDDIAIPALRNGLREDSSLKDDLHINTPQTWEDALHRANKFAEVEDRRSRFSKQPANQDFRKDENTKGKGPQLQQSKRNYPRNDRRVETFSVNSSSHEPERENTNSRWNKGLNIGTPDMNAYCEFHRRYGHWTSQCIQLQRELLKRYQKENPQRGGLNTNHREREPEAPRRNDGESPKGNNFSSKHKGLTDSTKRPNDDGQRRPYENDKDGLPPPRKRINMIMGGLVACKDSVRAIKKYEREAGAAQNYRVTTSENRQVKWIPDPDICFTNQDAVGLAMPHSDPLVIELRFADCDVSRVLIDTGSSVDLIFQETLEKMGLNDVKIKPSARPLTGFDGDTTMTVGTVKLPITLGGTTIWAKFHIVDKPAIYNAILGTPWIYAMKAVVSTYHQCLKFPTNGGTCTVRGNQQMARTCFVTEHKLRNKGKTFMVTSSTSSQDDRKVEINALEKVEQVNVDPSDETRRLGIGTEISSDMRTQLVEFLRQNIMTFAWTIEDMPGISTKIISHELNVDPTFKPVRQKRRKLGTERSRAVIEEVDRLLKAGSIIEVHYPEWLSNPVVVKKKTGKWRTCVDFTDLNKACPKDSFPLPRIDQLVEATAGNELLSFMDAFSGYNQIQMHPGDRDKTSFITDRGIYCYKVMPFGLKNAGATYQRLVNKMFDDQIGRTMEVYIDDMLVKSARAEDHLDHLATCFETLNKYEMKLNPTKCTFAVKSGEFLGYVVTKRGIEANPKQIKALTDLPSPRNKREIQRLTGRIAALNRFISRSTDKCLPFYKLLRNNKKFEWNDECESAFTELKRYLSTPPILAKPENGEMLYLYIAVTHAAISGVLVRDDRGEQKPVFYVSKSLNDAETRYATTEKLALAVVTSARKLRPYFQSHAITILTNHPLRSILHSPNQSGRLTKWAIELSEFDIDFKTRSSAKSQVLADFLVELEPEVRNNDRAGEKWSLFVDGSSSTRGAGVGIRLISPEGSILEQSFRLMFVASNNEAEYEALIAGLRLAQSLGVQKIEAFCDSQLVTSQFNGEFDAKNERMDAYLKVVQGFARDFSDFRLTKITRGENTSADALAALASTSDPEQFRIIPVEGIPTPSINLPKGNCLAMTKEVDQADATPKGSQSDKNFADWRSDIRAYISDGTLPKDRWAARRLKMRSAHYALYKEHLFRRTVDGTLLTCIHGDETKRVMQEVHLGAGGNHSGGRSLALKIRRLGYFWPTLNADCEKFATKCDACQRHAPILHSPAEFLASSTMPYPFMRWAMDIIGPFPPSRQKRFVLVLTDYFTKWVEAESYAKILDTDVRKFVWRNIICRHGLPYEIVTDNGSQFISAKFETFCASWRIRLSKATPRHPQGNGLAEASNKIIINGLKRRLNDKKGKWADELDGVLWSYRTTPRSTTGKTPFSLSHGTEALAPAEANIPNLRRAELPAHPETNNAMIKDSLDQVEELRDQALLKLQNYQQQAAKYYNVKVRGRHFREGDLVLRKVFENTMELNAGKLAENWEGPYIISKVVKPGVYELLRMDGTPIPRSWNAINLRQYYC